VSCCFYDAVQTYFYLSVGVESRKRLSSFMLFLIGTAFLHSSLKKYTASEDIGLKVWHSNQLEIFTNWRKLSRLRLHSCQFMTRNLKGQSSSV
jgi:hypothetical protein